MNAGRRTEPGAGRLALYSSRVLCRDRRRAQTYALSLNDDHGGAAETGGASPPRSGKPEGFPALPLEPRVQGRLARIDMVEDVFSCAGMHQRVLPVDGSANAPMAAAGAPTQKPRTQRHCAPERKRVVEGKGGAGRLDTGGRRI